MKTRVKIMIGAVALALSAGGSLAAVAATNGTNQPAPRASAKALRAPLLLPIDSTTESKFTPITPCRIVDTRKTGGRISTSHPRTFVSEGSLGFSAQGGTNTGCGIPFSATAIQANIVTTAGTGNGYLKVYPAGTTAPNASWMNYRDSKALANGGVVTLPTSGQFTVASAQHSTYVVIDVSGYYLPPMSAVVSASGGLVHGSRVTAASRLGTGLYQVDFDRNVTGCTYNANSYFFDQAVEVEPRVLDPDGVFVAVADTAGAAADGQFYLTVTC